MVINTYQKQYLIIESLFRLQNSKTFPSNDIRIHNAFFALKKDFPEYFERLKFDENGHFPISEDLDNILTDFLIYGFINYDMNSKNIYILTNNESSYKKRMRKYLPDINLKELKTISKELSEIL